MVKILLSPLVGRLARPAHVISPAQQPLRTWLGDDIGRTRVFMNTSSVVAVVEGVGVSSPAVQSPRAILFGKMQTEGVHRENRADLVAIPKLYALRLGAQGYRIEEQWTHAGEGGVEALACRLDFTFSNTVLPARSRLYPQLPLLHGRLAGAAGVPTPHVAVRAALRSRLSFVPQLASIQISGVVDGQVVTAFDHVGELSADSAGLFLSMASVHNARESTSKIDAWGVTSQAIEAANRAMWSADMALWATFFEGHPESGSKPDMTAAGLEYIKQTEQLLSRAQQAYKATAHGVAAECFTRAGVYALASQLRTPEARELAQQALYRAKMLWLRRSDAAERFARSLYNYAVTGNAGELVISE